MWSIDARRLLASSLLSAVFVFAGGWLPASGQPLPAAPPQPDATLEYRVHKGESLAEIARVFHLAPDELAQANGITDPIRLQIEQPLKVPNVFARQAAQLREERDGLAAEKAQLVRQVAAQAQVLAANDQQLQHHAGEKVALVRALAKSDHGRFVHLHTFSEKLLWSPGTHGNAGAGQNAALRLPLSFTAGALYAPSARLVCSLNVWDCANVLWSDLGQYP